MAHLEGVPHLFFKERGYFLKAAAEFVLLLHDAEERLMEQQTIGKTAGGNARLDLSQLPAGTYVAQVVADGKMVSANKVQLVK